MWSDQMVLSEEMGLQLPIPADMNELTALIPYRIK